MKTLKTLAKLAAILAAVPVAYVVLVNMLLAAPLLTVAAILSSGLFLSTAVRR